MRKPYGRSEYLAALRLSVGRPCTAGGPMGWTTGLALVMSLVAGLLGSCATAPASPEDKAALVTEARTRLQQMQTEDPSLGALLQKGYGYSLFPNVGVCAEFMQKITGPIKMVFGNHLWQHFRTDHQSDSVFRA